MAARVRVTTDTLAMIADPDIDVIVEATGHPVAGIAHARAAIAAGNIREIARAGSRVRRFAFGAGDFTLDANMIWTAGESELAYARSAIVTASRAAGLEPAIDSVWVRLDDEEGSGAACRCSVTT